MINIFKRKYASSKFHPGQTAVEVLVTLSIVALLSSTMILFNKRTQGEKELYEEARKFVIDLRAVQDLAFSMQSIGYETPCGYGLELLPDLAGYEVFAAMPEPDPLCVEDCATCDDIQAGSYVKQLIEGLPFLPQGRAYFSNLEVYSFTANPIIFVPPYPRTMFFPESDTALFQFSNKKAGTGSFADIQLNKAGQITLKKP